MSRAIQATKNSVPGPDKIYNEILKHLLPEGLDLLLVFYNKIKQQGYFPEKWLESTLLPTSKPGKDPTNPSMYRQIALTSYLCKVMERMVIVRLLDFFLPDWNAVNTTMWRQSETNNYRPFLVSESNSNEDPS